MKKMKIDRERERKRERAYKDKLRRLLKEEKEEKKVLRILSIDNYKDINNLFVTVQSFLLHLKVKDILLLSFSLSH